MSDPTDDETLDDFREAQETGHQPEPLVADQDDLPVVDDPDDELLPDDDRPVPLDTDDDAV